MMESINTRFVKIHPNFSCMFNTTEISFIILLLDQEYLKSIGLDSNWSRAYFQKSMKVGNDAFVKSTSRLERLGLLSITEKRSGNKKGYSLNVESFNKALSILDATNNRMALYKFCETKFVEQNKRIQDISKEELEELEGTRKFQKRSSMSESGKFNPKACPNHIYLENDSIQTMSESDILLKKACSNPTYSSVKSGEAILYSRIIQDLDVEIQKLLFLKEKYMSESGIVSEAACSKQTDSFIDEEISSMSKTDILNDEPCLKQTYYNPKNESTMSESGILLEQPCLNPTYSIENVGGKTTTMSESDILCPKNDKSIPDSDISIEYIYNNINNINYKNNKEYILDNYKNASERSIFNKGGERMKDDEEKFLSLSKNQKFIDSLIKDMKEEFPEGDRPKREEVQSFFSELKEDHLSHDPELLQLTLEDIFPHFQSSGIRICTYYSEHKEKTHEELKEEFMSLPVSEDYDETLLGLTDQEKVEMIKADFRESFPEGERVEIDDMTHYVVGYMRDLELMKVDQVLYNSPLLLPYLFPEIQNDKGTKLWFRKPYEAPICKIVGNEGKFIDIKTKFKEEAENARKRSNPFYEKLKRFRFPRITVSSTGTCNASEIIPKVLVELGYENGMYEDLEVIDQILDVIIDKFKLQGKSFEPFKDIWVYCDRFHHKRKGKILISNLPEIKKMKA